MSETKSDIEKKPPFATRIDLRKLAGLARVFVMKGGQRVFTKSDLISETLETFHDLLLEQGILEPVLTYEEAIEVLQRVGITFEFGTPQHKSIVELLQRENISLEDFAKADDEELESIAKRMMRDMERGR